MANVRLIGKPRPEGTGVKAADFHGNLVAREGQDRCHCGCKYWESDACIDCGTTIRELMADTRLERIDLLADRLLNLSRYADTPATEVWDIARDRIDQRDREILS